ncbi:MAG: SCO family protein [Aestuariibacter sp.]
MNKSLVGIVAFIALVIGIYVAISIQPPVAAPEYLQAYPEPRPLAPVELLSHTGEAIKNDWFYEQWTLAFVGYTFCPDICPTTLAELKGAYPELQAIASQYPIEVLFLSVDPKRDTQERLHEYIQFFNPEFTAATAQHKALFPLVRSMGMAYAIVDSTDDPNYLVDHSASVVLINPQGKVVGRFKPHHEPGKLAISSMQQIIQDMKTIAG